MAGLCGVTLPSLATLLLLFLSGVSRRKEPPAPTDSVARSSLSDDLEV